MATNNSINANSTTPLPIVDGGTQVTSVTTTPTATAFAGWDANSNLSADMFLPGFATTATGGTTTTLTVNSVQTQEFTGTLTQTVVLPVVSTLATGTQFFIINNSSGVVTVNSSGANLVLAMAGNTSAIFTSVLNTGTTAASWNATYVVDSGGGVSPGTANQLAYYATTGNNVSGLTSANSASLVTNSTGVPAWSGTMTNGQVIMGSTGATPTAATITAGTGISVTNGAASITITATGAGFAWSSVAGTTQAAAVENGYILANASQTTVTLPSTYAIGDTVIVVGSTANTGGWVLTAATGDTIRVNNSTTSTGGTVTSSAVAGQTIEVVCDVANTSWVMSNTSSVILTTA